jgi:hypothetical protein
MPQIIVIDDHDNGQILHQERVSLADFESQHFASQLVERLGWAVGDADELECATPRRPAQRPAAPGARRTDASVVTTAS